MHLRTTVGLLVLVAAGGVVYFYGAEPLRKVGLLSRPPADADAGTLAVLAECKPDQVMRIDVKPADGEAFDLTATKVGGKDGTTWTLPGNWPVRKPEVEELVRTLTGLRSRFQPVPIGPDGKLDAFGLAESQKPVTVTVEANAQKYRLTFGRPKPGETENPFAVPTYVRLDERPEVIRLGPDVIDVVKRPRSYYQKRQLFGDAERVKLPSEPPPPAMPGMPPPPPPQGPAVVPVTLAAGLVIDGPSGKLALKRVGDYPKPEVGGKSSDMTVKPEDLADAWELAEPIRDRVDPARLRPLVAAVPELWVEKFLSEADLKAAEPTNEADPLKKTGLDKPERKLTVTPPGGKPVTLEVGKVSRVEMRGGGAPPPPANPFQPPPPPPKVTREEYRYAKLADNPQVFEVRADKLNDLFIAPDSARDANLVRFRASDAKRIEIKVKDQKIVLTKDKPEPGSGRFTEEKWRLAEPVQALAERTKVSDLLDKLTGLEARGKDVIDNPDPKAIGFEPNAPVLAVDIEPEPADPAAPPKARSVRLRFGKAEMGKVPVRVQGWDRVNLVDDAILKLVEQPALAYRGRRIFDFPSSQVEQIAVQRDADPYQLDRDVATAGGSWKLTAPAAADADSGKAGLLADDLSRLEVVEFVNDAPKPEDLTTYGLDKPALTVRMRRIGDAKPTVMQVGKLREGKPEFYAKLETGPGVFTIRKELKESLDQTSLALRPLQVWQFQPDAVTALEVERAGEKYALKRDGIDWKLSGAFDATANFGTVQSILDSADNLRAERFEAHKADDPAKYGLDKPTLKVTITAKESKPVAGADPKETPVTKTLLVGKPVKEGDPQRFARLDGDGAVFVIGANLATAVDKSALDLLDRKLLLLDRTAITQLQVAGPDGQAVVLKKDGANWKVEGTPAFPVDRESVAGTVTALSNLQAEKYVAYGPTADLPKYGLDKPAYTLTVTQQAGPVDPNPKSEPVELKLGKPVEGGAAGGRYAMVGKGPGVAVLAEKSAAGLVKGRLDFVDRTLLTADPAKVTQVRRTIGKDELKLERKDGWKIVKPAEQTADEQGTDDLVDRLAHLRAKSVAAFAQADLKPFGLDPPYAVLELGGDDKPAEHTLQIGGPVSDKAPDGERYVRVGKSDVIGVLDARLSKQLVAAPVAFRDRGLARFPDADKATLERGERKLTFQRTGGTWKLTEPLADDAEHTDLEEFFNALARLRADELVAEKPEDLKPFGLDKPQSHWRFFAGANEVLSLAVGGREKVGEPGKPSDGPRAYAKLEKGDLVFLLDPALTTRALAEYRKRTLWTGLDAAQVETLTYKSPSGTFTLRKQGGNWVVEGKPDVKVKADAVSDTLAALATLKAERYVKDKDADLKLYGLAPDQATVIEAVGPTGKQVLEVGNKEGGSARAYARLPDPKRSDVFVLSEADTAKIVRELGAFTQK